MNRTLLKAQLLYDEMGKSEKRIADFLLSHSGEVLPYTITELAERCESSEATIVRFSRRLGFAGFQQLKIALAQQTERRIVSPNVTRGDTCYEIFEKVCNDVYLSFERTRRTLDASALEKASAAIAGAERVVLVGLGSSASVASDAANEFMRAGCNSVAYSDTASPSRAHPRISLRHSKWRAYAAPLPSVSRGGSVRPSGVSPTFCLSPTPRRSATALRG